MSMKECEARTGEPAGGAWQAGGLVKYAGKTDVNGTGDELGSADTGDGKCHGAEAEDVGQERDAELLEASDHELKVP
jgi:hypothetical protein